MGSSSKEIEYSANSGLRLSPGVHARKRGLPTVCRCGEEVVMRTSGSAKNPGRLFHACPYGSEMAKDHFFKWTDLSMVEEIEDMKKKIEMLGNQIRSSEEMLNCLGKDLETLKTELDGGGREMDMCFFKKLVCCFLP